ncbi:hypothetical protein L903_17855 [Agrobacterium sp. JL28]|nr:hypothetical protein L903_17855 [Agrobacterium sp. JL28]KVK50534.1 hypothetical protein L904_17860 [Agrobacterium sp. LY4]KVK60142.1 hypothetical protein L906_23090 [Agrobacterium sp. TS45]
MMFLPKRLIGVAVLLKAFPCADQSLAMTATYKMH